MSKGKRFNIGDVFSVTTGRLVSPRRLEGICDLQGYMMSEIGWDDVLARPFPECLSPYELRKALLLQFPVLDPGVYDFTALLESYLALAGIHGHTPECRFELVCESLTAWANSASRVSSAVDLKSFTIGPIVPLKGLAK